MSHRLISPARVRKYAKACGEGNENLRISQEFLNALDAKIRKVVYDSVEKIPTNRKTLYDLW